MSYFTQQIVAQGEVDNLKVIIREGLNDKADLELRIEVPKELWPAYNDVSYRYEQRGSLYFGKNSETGEVRFFSYEAPGNGFGGDKITINMLDDSQKTLIGPWSSRCGCMNAADFPPSKEVNIASRYNMASALTVERINELISPLGFICIPERSPSRYDIGYNIVRA